MSVSGKVIDLFAGVGGLSLGFEQAGFEIVLANEFDSEIGKSYLSNHKNVELIIDDISKINLKSVFSRFKGEIDIIIGGPPCQGFSQKGKRKSINDDRNFLFKSFVSVVELVRPQYFVMENVPNLLTTENGYFKKEIYELFEKLGYTLSSGILNSADFGIPQNRRRAIIVGKLGKMGLELPKPTLNKVSIWDAISDLAFLNSGEGDFEQNYKFPSKTEYQSEMRGNSSKLYNHIATSHSEIALERLKMIPQNGGKENLPHEHLTKSIYSGTWTRMRKEEQSVTITTRFDTPSSGKFTHPYLHRAITVREAARIQSFPDNFIFWGSKSSQMKQVGNAVPPKLANAIATIIKKDMEKNNDKGI